MKKHQLTGMRFGRLIVLGQSASRGGNSTWDCLCDCGNSAIVTGSCLVAGDTNSCGCLRCTSLGHARAGKRRSSSYMLWVGMRQRCENKSHNAYPSYGGRGIVVCERWKQFANFFADMGVRPNGLTLDRIDNDKGYSPDNCKWSTHAEQGKNKRTNKFVLFNGEKLTQSEFAKRIGISNATTHRRISLGWSAEKIAGTPVRKMKNKSTLGAVK